MSVLIVNNFQLVDVSMPFYDWVSRMSTKASFGKMFVTPKDTIKTERIRRYKVIVNATHMASTHTFTFKRLKCHAIYRTNPSLSVIARENFLDKYKKSMLSNSVEFGYIKSAIMAVVRSYDFGRVVTDCPGFFDFPVIDISEHKVNLSSANSTIAKLMSPSPTEKLCNLPAEVLVNLTAEEIGLPLYEDSKPVLILTFMNQYVPYVLGELYGLDEYLPLCIFLNAKMKDQNHG